MSRQGGWANRPIGERERRGALAAAAVVLALTAIVLSMLAPAPAPKRDAAKRPPQVVVDAPTAQATPAPTATPTAALPRPALDAGQQRAALAQARSFLAAYLRYEAGDHSPGVRRGLRRTATASFARELLRDLPRIPTGARPRQGRIDGLELSDDLNAQPLAVVATIERGESITPLSVQLERQGDRWCVTSIG